MKWWWFILFIFLLSCKKEKEYCWQTYDALGNETGVVCGKTEAEMTSTYGNFFDRADAQKFCWKIVFTNGSISYPENISEKMAGLFFSTAVSREKFTCGYCQKWISREKHLHKASGSFHYSSLKTEQYCGDTATTLFVGRIVTLRNTPDSLITAEFLEKR